MRNNEYKHVCFEDWKEMRRREPMDSTHPCDAWPAEECMCGGACSCHWEHDKGRVETALVDDVSDKPISLDERKSIMEWFEKLPAEKKGVDDMENNGILRPFTVDEIRSILVSTLRGPLSGETMLRLFATLAEWSRVIEGIDVQNSFVDDVERVHEALKCALDGSESMRREAEQGNIEALKISTTGCQAALTELVTALGHAIELVRTRSDLAVARSEYASKRSELQMSNDFEQSLPKQNGN